MTTWASGNVTMTSPWVVYTTSVSSSPVTVSPPERPKTELELLDERVEGTCRAGRSALGT